MNNHLDSDSDQRVIGQLLRAWARERGTSESEAVRDAVRLALAGQEMVAALQGLHDVEAFADLERLFPPRVESPPPKTRKL